MTKKIYPAIGIVLLLACGVVVANQRTAARRAAQRAAQVEKEKKVSLRQVVQTLTQEAEQALRKGKPMPRTTSDYAQSKGNIILEKRDLMMGLTRPADRNPLVDAYIKWQLLSFHPDFSKMSPFELVRVIDAIPVLKPVGQMNPKSAAILKAAGSGRSKDTPAQLLKIIKQFEKQQKRVRNANKPNDAYRREVFQATSSDKGLQLIAKFKELDLLIEGGESRKVRVFIKKLIKELQSLRTDKNLSRPLRGELVRRLKLIAQHKRHVVSNVAMKASGKVAFNEITVQLPKVKVDEMTAYLDGRKYIPQKKKKGRRGRRRGRRW